MAVSNMQDRFGLKSRTGDVDRQLDDASAESFATSDPIALTQPHDPEELGLRRPIMSPSAWLVVGGGLLGLLALIALRK